MSSGGCACVCCGGGGGRGGVELQTLKVQQFVQCGRVAGYAATLLVACC
jgi:hypothetical protein